MMKKLSSVFLLFSLNCIAMDTPGREAFSQRDKEIVTAINAEDITILDQFADSLMRHFIPYHQGFFWWTQHIKLSPLLYAALKGKWDAAQYLAENGLSAEFLSDEGEKKYELEEGEEFVGTPSALSFILEKCFSKQNSDEIFNLVKKILEQKVEVSAEDVEWLGKRFPRKFDVFITYFTLEQQRDYIHIIVKYASLAKMNNILNEIREKFYKDYDNCLLRALENASEIKSMLLKRAEEERQK